MWSADYYPEGCPPSSSVSLHFDATEKNLSPIQMTWSDGGIKPFHPDLLPADVSIESNGIIMIGEKGVITCDAYENAPAMQVSDQSEVFNMLDKNKLTKIIENHKPDFIVPEVEAIETQVLLDAEKNGYTVIPSAKAVNLTMNRDRIRDRAKSLGLQTASFSYAETEQELISEANDL